MGLKKVKKKLVKLADAAYWKGWSVGYDSGRESYEEEEYENGWEARGENIQTRLKMLEEGYMNDGKGAKAVMVREIAELIAIEINLAETD